MNNKYEDELREKYLGCMREIKHRTAVIKGFLMGKWHAGYVASTAECVALQFRKTLELIALASLVANREEYAKQNANFSKAWNAKMIVKELKKVNSRFYPEPTEPKRLNPEDAANYDLQPVADYLTLDNYITLFDICNDMLHAANPYSTNQPPYEQFINQAPNWLRKTMALLNHHHIHPLDTNLMFIVQMRHSEQPVSLTTFVKIAAEQP